MDVSSISATTVMMQAAQTQQGMATSLMKMAAGQQGQLADMLSQSVENASRIVAESGYGFSLHV